MNLRTVTMGVGVLGGVCWVLRLVLDVAGSGNGAFLDVLEWAGLVMVGVALAALGAGLVGKSELWLRVIVALAFPLLVWSVLEVLRPAGNPAVVDGLLGAVVLATCARRLTRDGGPAAAPRAHGAHAR